MQLDQCLAGWLGLEKGTENKPMLYNIETCRLKDIARYQRM